MTQKYRTIVFAVCLICLTAILEAQSSQVEQPALASAADAADAAKTRQSPYKLSARVDRVVVDVVVTDARGNSVEGLKQDNFKLMEDGVAQPIRFFDAHTAATRAASQHVLGLHLPPNTFSNLTASPPDKPVTILFYDMLDTPEDELPFAHDQIVRFIKNRQSSRQIAIFALTNRLHMLQGFTDDETKLIQAINLKKATKQAPILRDAPLTEGGDFLLLNNEIEELISHSIRRLLLQEEAFIEMCRYVSALPGRKNLIWLSGTFPPNLFPDRPLNEEDPFLEPGLRAARIQLAQSRVALYPVDIGGLQGDPQYSAATLQTISSYGAQPNYFAWGNGLHDRAMDIIAKNTGGKAFYNTNGLKEAMDTAMRQGAEYYSLTYAPGEARRDRPEHEIKVVLNKPGYELSYRRRYLAPDDKSSTPSRPLALGMKHGAPNSSELFFEAHVVPVGAPMPASPEELQALAKSSQHDPKSDRGKRAGGPRTVQHYDINFALIGRALEMPALDDGQHASDLRFALAAYAEDSGLLNGAEISLKNSIPAEQFHKIESDGYHASMLFAVPVDAVSLRMGVRDEIGGRIGTIEVPLPLPVVAAATGSAGHDAGTTGSQQ